MLFGGVPRIVSHFTLQPVQHKALHRIHPAILRVGPDDVLCLLLDACGSKSLENVRLPGSEDRCVATHGARRPRLVQTQCSVGAPGTLHAE